MVEVTSLYLRLGRALHQTKGVCNKDCPSELTGYSPISVSRRCFCRDMSVPAYTCTRLWQISHISHVSRSRPEDIAIKQKRSTVGMELERYNLELNIWQSMTRSLVDDRDVLRSVAAIPWFCRLPTQRHPLVDGIFYRKRLKSTSVRAYKRTAMSKNHNKVQRPFPRTGFSRTRLR